ncbi:MAG: hypothetical protein IH624_15920 [Phycisphaerae bacterium]|nr:hypothetical protein [Phycisphaerae bacterium]
MTWDIWQILYFAAWLCLGVHCLRRKRFFPILGPGLSTKLFWLATFLFFNPFLTVLYLVFGVMLPGLAPDRKHPVARLVSVLAVVMVAATLVFFELPALGKPRGPVTLARGEENTGDTSGLGLKASAGKLESKNNYSTTTSSMHSQNARLNVTSILILCQDDHPLLDLAARALQEQLAALPYVQRVTYYPPSEAVEMQQVLPDAFIMLAMPRIDEGKSLVGRKLNATITCSAGRTIYPGHSYTSYMNAPPVINFGIKSVLQHESNFTGIESRQSRYTQQAESIAAQIAKGLTEQFDKWKDEHGLMPELPDFLYGVCRAGAWGPQAPFLQGEFARMLASGAGLLLNNHTTWMFTDDRPTLDVLKDCRDQLAELGYRGGTDLDRASEHPIESVTLSKGDEHITIFRRRRGDHDAGSAASGPADAMPMVANYQSLFTEEQMHAAMDRLLDSDVDLETVMIFERSIRSDEQKQKLLSRIEQSPVQSMRGWLTLAGFYADAKQADKAAAAFMRARAMSYAEKQHNPEPGRFKEIAKKLGDESLAKADVDMKCFTEAGFINMTDTAEPVVIEKGLNEPAAFCVVDDNGGISTAVIRIRPAATPAKAPDQSPQYEIMQVVKTRDSTAVGTSGYYIGSTALHIQEFGALNVKIETLADRRFRFEVQAARGNPTR